jgi:hypothetical protein
MSSQPNAQDLRVPDGKSWSLDSEIESWYCSQGSQDRPKHVDKTFRCWKFRDFIQADVSDDSSKLQLIEHIQTQFTHHRLACVWTVTVFADLNQYLFAVSKENPTFSFKIVGYVQTNRSRLSAAESLPSPWNGSGLSNMIDLPQKKL